ncbi:MAG TPA: prephenate dehydratase domain-containing protein [Candidatus Dojkabacteria bacterium]|jgi:chorismate mutase/prephenate dehydratase
MKIYFLGPEGSFSHLAAKSKYEEKHLESKSNFLEIINALDDGDSIGVLPIENSITSDVHENMDYFFKKKFTIIGEVNVKIHLHLIGLKDTEINNITDVYSHPKALAQCSEFLNKIGNPEIHFTESTSKAREEIVRKKSKKSALIGSKDLAESPLSTIVEDISNSTLNLTRFLFVSSALKSNKSKANKMTIIFKIKHEAGSLSKLLMALARAGVNLMKIESRPIPNTVWEYQFWVDLEVNPEQILSVENVFKKESLDYSVLGAYERGQIIES